MRSICIAVRTAKFTVCCAGTLLMSLSGARAVEPVQMTGCLSPLGVLLKLSLGDKPARPCWPKEQEVSLRLGAEADPGVKLAFITSETFNGNLGGIVGADQKCQTLAAAAGLEGTYRAWLSDTQSSPASDPTFYKNSGPYVRLDGARVAQSWEDLTDWTLLAPIEVDERGEHWGNRIRRSDEYQAGESVWTGTLPVGEADGENASIRCQDWTSADGNNRGLRGYFTNPNCSWTGCDWPERFDQASAVCSTKLALYCFQQ